MKEADFIIRQNDLLAPSVYRMVLEGDTSGIVTPGQFVEVRLPGFFLRRPISVCDAEQGRLILIYKTVGRGTDEMSRMKEGTTLNLLTGLGHGFSVGKGEHPVLIGGGVGIPPLFLLAKKWIEIGKRPYVILGFNTAKEVFLKEEFSALGLETVVTTADGSLGIKGFVTAAMERLPEDIDFFQSCGPLPMLRSVCESTSLEGEISLEERMGCGFGACMGCTIHTEAGPARVCTEGPVFDRRNINWKLL